MQDQKPPYYITTPIYYVNDKPHMGTAYTSFAADTLARFMKLDGYNVFFLTGTDEHGQKVEQAAALNQLSPQIYCDQMSANFEKMSNIFNFEPDFFMRTTDPQHAKAVQNFWQVLKQNNQIYKGFYKGWYSIRDETFYQSDELIDGKAPTGAEVNFIEEESYFFKLSQWQQPLLEWYEKNPNVIAPSSRRNEVINFVKSGLRDLSISRSSFKWGVPVPDDDKHIMYVWVEALPNYITALGYPDQQSTNFETYWPHVLHLLGKDILRFHAVYWPALLMAAGLDLPRRIFAHGWWTNNGQKMSKSLGNTVDPFKLVQEYGSDQVRYFLMREIAFGQDGDFSMPAFSQRINADLANDLGNLVQRVMSFIYNHCSAEVPPQHKLDAADFELLALSSEALISLRDHAQRQELNRMLEVIWKTIASANRYIDFQAPWTLRKTNPARMESVLYTLTEFIRRTAILVQPFLPFAAQKIFTILGMKHTKYMFSDLLTFIDENQLIQQPQVLFPKIEFTHNL